MKSPNQAATVDGGIALRPQAGRAQPAATDPRRWAFMYALRTIFAAAVFLTSGCTGPKYSCEVSDLPPPKDGKILIVIGGRSPARGEHWVAAESSLADIAELTRVDPPCLNIIIMSADGRHQKRYRMKDLGREQKGRISLHHGDYIVIPFDRCWGWEPNNKGCPRQRPDGVSVPCRTPTAGRA
jgi:hypothetical protein